MTLMHGDADIVAPIKQFEIREKALDFSRKLNFEPARERDPLAASGHLSCCPT